jgi:hypothetical protein
MTRPIPAVLGASIGALLLFGAQSADAAAECGLEGRWDVYLTLSHLDDAEEEPVPWPATAATCLFVIDGNGMLRPGLNCEGVYAGSRVEVYVEGFDLRLDRNCRFLPDASLNFELQTALIQTQDQYSCRPQGAMVRSGQAMHGLLACGHVPEPFVMVRRVRRTANGAAGGA